MNLHERLLQRSKMGMLGHFYIIDSHLPENTAIDELVNFTQKFIKSYYLEVEKATHFPHALNDHPDIFLLGNLTHSKDKETAPFNVEQAAELHRFFEFKPIQSKRKFAVITEAHRVSALVANKWLKLFEEPQGESTIFLLNPRSQKLLGTIESRAIQIHLPKREIKSENGTDQWSSFLEDIQKLSLASFLEKYQKSERPMAEWVQDYLAWEAKSLDHATAKEAATLWTKTFQEFETFHQQSATKWTLFYAHLKEHALNRLSR